MERRIELASAIHRYIEQFHSRRRRHSVGSPQPNTRTDIYKLLNPDTKKPGQIGVSPKPGETPVDADCGLT